MKTLNAPDELGGTFSGVNHLVVVLGVDAMACCERRGRGGKSEWVMSLVYHAKDFHRTRRPPPDISTYVSLTVVSAAEELARNCANLTRAKLGGHLRDAVKRAVVRCRRYSTLGLKRREPDEGEKIVTDRWCADLLEPSSKDEQENADDYIHESAVAREARWTLLRSLCKQLGAQPPEAVAKKTNAGGAAETNPPSRPGGDLAAGALSIARKIVTDGLDAAQKKHKFPVARLGKWTGVDLDEIEGYQSLRRLMRKYLENPNWERPLRSRRSARRGRASLTASARSPRACARRSAAAARWPRTPWSLTWAGSPPSGTWSAPCTSSRNATLGGHVPLVMFDEFDATFDGRPHGWLKYLLAPTQDGRFRDGDTEYNVGRAIFVFVGGVSATFDDLAGQMRSRSFVEAKGRTSSAACAGTSTSAGPTRPARTTPSTSSVGRCCSAATSKNSSAGTTSSGPRSTPPSPPRS